MLHAALLTLSTLLLSTLTIASPTPSALLPRTCSPNFQGRAQTIFVRPPVTDIGIYEWTPSSIAPGANISLRKRNVNDAFAEEEFLVEFTGQPNGSYRFKLAADTNRYIALTAGADGTLTFANILGASTPSQEFTITCASCPAPDDGTDAKRCTIAHPGVWAVCDRLNGRCHAQPRGVRRCWSVFTLARFLSSFCSSQVN